MNCSENLKRREERRRKNQIRFRRMFIVALFMGMAVGFLMGRCTALIMDKPSKPEPTSEPVMIIPEPTATIIAENMEAIESPAPVLLGKYRITAYCACEKCCGEWAKKRPNGVVYGAAGIELKAGVSCASPLPFGTVVEVEGLGEYIVHDRTAAWVAEKYDNKVIDIYFDNHEAALRFGLQNLNVYLKEEKL